METAHSKNIYLKSVVTTPDGKGIVSKLDCNDYHEFATVMLEKTWHYGNQPNNGYQQKIYGETPPYSMGERYKIEDITLLN